MNNEIKTLDNGDFEVIYPKGSNREFFEKVVGCCLVGWFLAVVTVGIIGVIKSFA